MKRLLATFLVALEVMICFGPAAMLWGLGIVFAPVGVISDPERDPKEIAILAMLVAGAFGILSLLAVLDALVAERPPQLSTRFIVIFAVLGTAALLPLVFGLFDFPGGRLIGLLPIVCFVHLLYLARTTLFPRRPQPAGMPS